MLRGGRPAHEVDRRRGRHCRRGCRRHYAGALAARARHGAYHQSGRIRPLIPWATGYQILQSLYAIGSGGLMGSGIGNSRQKYLFLPEPQNDYVFCGRL